MNKNIDLVYGFLIGIAASFIGSYLFILAFTNFGFQEGIATLKLNGRLGQLITIGAVLNLAVFFLLLKKRKDLMAKGVILATAVLAAITIFV